MKNPDPNQDRMNKDKIKPAHLWTRVRYLLTVLDMAPPYRIKTLEAKIFRIPPQLGAEVKQISTIKRHRKGELQG